MRFGVTVYLFTFLGFASHGISEEPTAHTSDALSHWFLRDYPKAYQSLVDYYANIVGTATQSSVDTHDAASPFVTTMVFEFARSNGSVRLIATARTNEPNQKVEAKAKLEEARSKGKTRTVPSYTQAIICYDTKSFFRLGRSTPNAPYVLELLGNDVDYRSAYARYGLSRMCDFATKLGETSIMTLISRPSFSISRVSEEKHSSGNRLLKVEFSDKGGAGMAKRSSSTIVGKGSFDPDRGWFLVAPDAHWALYGYEISYRQNFSRPTSRRSGPITYSGSVDYTDDVNDFPIPRRVSHKITGFKAGDRLGSIEFTNFQLQALPKRDFTMPAFGLPDVARPTRPIYWPQNAFLFIVIGLMLFTITYLLRHYKQRLDLQ